VKHLVLAVAMLGIAVGFAACGKKGPPDPPGPADQITYPRAYPVAPPGPPAAVSPPAQWPFGITPSVK
jgi:predicted small lipoprotein YifL